tara:strand:+ start:757 stop:1332 length:576 start_codon:yes stop_codon:yes gene_type:complete
MTRSIGTDFLAQLNSSQIEPFLAVSIGFTTPLNIWTGYNTITFGSVEYFPSGNLLSITDIEESADIRANGVKIGLSGLDSSIIQSALTEDSQGKIVKIFFGVLTTTSNETVIVDTPYQTFEGFIDTMSIIESDNTAQVAVNVENKLIILEKANNRRYTDQDQKNFFPNDKGLEFVESIQDKSINWGGGSII